MIQFIFSPHHSPGLCLPTTYVVGLVKFEKISPSNCILLIQMPHIPHSDVWNVCPSRLVLKGWHQLAHRSPDFVLMIGVVIRARILKLPVSF